MTGLPRVTSALMNSPWAIMPDRLEAIAEVVERRLEGVRLSADEIASLKGERRPNGVTTMYRETSSGLVAPFAAGNGQSAAKPAIAVISVFGIIAQHASQVDDISGPGGTSTDRVSNSLKTALADPNVGSIILNVDSPGGNVYGVQALANQIFQARGTKPIVAQVNSLAASAAYWIASAASEIVITPGGQVGSIGVYTLHADASKAAAAQGLKFTFISAGKYKIEGNQFEPLGDEAGAALQSQIDSYYADFTNAVARGRNAPVANVRNGFGQGRVVKDNDAVRQGMADRVATLDATLQRLMNSRSSSSPGKASAQDAFNASAETDEQRLRRHRLREIAPPAATTPKQAIEPDHAFRQRRHQERRRSTLE